MSGPARAVVFGSGGQVGAALRAAAPADWTVRFCDRAGADVTDPAAVREAVGAACDLVVNVAAYTAVDKAEAEPERAFAANADGAGHVAAASDAAGALLVHLSTDYVFDGAKTGAYDEHDPVAPLSVYGRSKAAGEDAVRAACPRHVVLRTARIFGPRPQNFVATMLRLGRERSTLKVVADQTGCPTPADAIAVAVWRIAARLRAGEAVAAGTYHFAGQPAVSWHGFAEAIFAAAVPFGVRAPRLEPVSAAAFPTPAARPRNAALDCGRIATALGIAAPAWAPALGPCVQALLQPAAAGAAP